MKDRLVQAVALSRSLEGCPQHSTAARDAAGGDRTGHLDGTRVMPCEGAGGCSNLFQSISASTIERWGAEGGRDGTPGDHMQQLVVAGLDVPTSLRPASSASCAATSKRRPSLDLADQRAAGP